MGIWAKIRSGNAPLGATIETLGDDDLYMGSGFRMAKFPDLGTGTIVISRSNSKAVRSTFARGAYVLWGLEEIGNTEADAIWGSWLTEGDFDLLAVGEEGEEDLEFTGPGPMHYLNDARVWHESNDGWPYIIAGEWVWNADGNSDLGHVANRLLVEAQARSGDLLRDLTWDFTANQDSASVDWREFNGQFTLPIGMNYLEAFEILRKQGGFHPFMSPQLVLSAYKALTSLPNHGSNSFGPAAVRFEKGINIETGLTEAMKARWKATHALIEGKDLTYVNEVLPGYDPGELRREIFIAAEEVKDPDDLHEIGADALQRQIDAETPREVGFTPGNDPSTGKYLPGLHFNVGERIRLHTGSGTNYDVNEQDLRVFAIRVDMKEADDATDPGIECVVELSDKGNSGAGEGAGTGGLADDGGADDSGRCRCRRRPVPHICEPSTPGTPDGMSLSFERHWSFTSGVDSDEGGWPWMDNWNPLASDGMPAGHGWNGLTYDSVGQGPHIPCSPGEILTFSGLGSSRTHGLATKRFTIRWYLDTTDVIANATEVVYIDSSSRTVVVPFEFIRTVPAGIGGVEIEADRQFRVDDLYLSVAAVVAGEEGTEGCEPEPIGLPGEGTAGENDGSILGANHIHEHGYLMGDGAHLHSAEQVGIGDADELFNSTDVEGALEEVGADALTHLRKTGGEQHVVHDYGDLGATAEFDLTDGNILRGTLDGADCDITFVGVTAGVGAVWSVHIVGDTASVPSFPDVLWPNDTPPTFDPAAGSHWLQFVSVDGGTTIYGSYGGSAEAAALITREVAGTDIDPTTELEFDADDFAVSDEGGGVARVALAGGGGGGITPSYVRAALTGTQALTNGSAVYLNYDADTYDPDGYHSTSSNTSRLTVPTGKGGVFWVHAFSYTTSNPGTGSGCHIRKNGTTIVGAGTGVSGTSAGTFEAGCLVELADGDYVEFAITVAAASKNALDAGVVDPYFEMHKVA